MIGVGIEDAGAARIVVDMQAMLSRIVSTIIHRIVVVMMSVVIMIMAVMVVTMMNMVFVTMRVGMK